MEEIIRILTLKNKTISTMESCTGGAVVNSITNIEGASNVLQFSAVTYSNLYKIKMGVSKDIIDTYSVYSIETARSMSKAISLFTDSNYGIGITGKLNRADENNNFGKDNEVFISIYDKDNDKYYDFNLIVDLKTRKENKELIIQKIVSELLNII